MPTEDAAHGQMKWNAHSEMNELRSRRELPGSLSLLLFFPEKLHVRGGNWMAYPVGKEEGKRRRDPGSGRCSI
jgi:hypothetical protein